MALRTLGLAAMMGAAALSLAAPLAAQTIDYGDDSGPYPMDGECDDPRFAGEGVWSGANETARLGDASDCRAAVAAGTARLIEGNGDTGTGGGDGGGMGASLAIPYGDDSGPFARDGECDDPRFTGPGVWSGAGEIGRLADATDCRAAMEARTATYTGEE